jgi:hypothetical protein
MSQRSFWFLASFRLRPMIGGNSRAPADVRRHRLGIFLWCRHGFSMRVVWFYLGIARKATLKDLAVSQWRTKTLPPSPRLRRARARGSCNWIGWNRMRGRVKPSESLTPGRLERFKKFCSHADGEKERAVFLGFGFVSAQLQGFTNLRLRQRPMIGTTRQNTKNPRSAWLQNFLKRSKPDDREHGTPNNPRGPTLF